ncbi:6567_t:CDS:2 [Diversispora eburnea]|uniref:6567_t:CDS:1 n=1 Tax=Diversispora eburnea TaxID=1213867 RepID=A0A9N9ADC5_9GLOM|nr:6567_t:CDS:2 [Diversispora eburnea]
MVSNQNASYPKISRYSQISPLQPPPYSNARSDSQDNINERKLLFVHRQSAEDCISENTNNNKNRFHPYSITPTTPPPHISSSRLNNPLLERQNKFLVRPKNQQTEKERYGYQREFYASSKIINNVYSGLRKDWIYKLEVVQNPSRARACGFGNRDIRPISPAIIVRLQIYFDNEPVDINEIDVHFFHLRATLFDEETKTDHTIVSVKSTHRSDEDIENLVGNKSSDCKKLNDLNGNPGLWFIFTELSVRTERDYFLRFSLHDLGCLGRIYTGDFAMDELATVDSDNFKVFRSNQFPGVAGMRSLRII